MFVEQFYFKAKSYNHDFICFVGKFVVLFCFVWSLNLYVFNKTFCWQWIDLRYGNKAPKNEVHHIFERNGLEFLCPLKWNILQNGFYINIKNQLTRGLLSTQVKLWHVCQNSCNELEGLINYLKLVCFPKLSPGKYVPNCQRQKCLLMQQQLLRGLDQPSKPKINKKFKLKWYFLDMFSNRYNKY